MKAKDKIFYCWLLIFMLFDVVDLITTNIGLGLGLSETNIVTAQFFLLGPIGYLFAMMWSTSFFLIFFLSAELVFRLYVLMTNEEPHISLYWSAFTLIAITFIIAKIQAIINNLMLIALS